MSDVESLSPAFSTVGLKVALRIIDSWNASPSQACQILRISPAAYELATSGKKNKFMLNTDQQQRISLILNIHTALRAVFSNPENVVAFPGLKNNNPFFEGRSPLEIMSRGDFNSLHETYKRINQLRLPL